MPGEAKRIQGGIHATTNIEVATARGVVDAVLEDLANSGCRFVSNTPVGDKGESVEILFPLAATNETATIAATLDGSESGVDGHITLAFFNQEDPRVRQVVLELISASGGGTRAQPRLTWRTEIQCSQPSDLKAVLEDISAGGLCMTVADRLSADQMVDITIPDLSGAQLLILKARVVHQREVTDAGEKLYRVGLEFAPMRPETQRCLDELMRCIVEVMFQESNAAKP